MLKHFQSKRAQGKKILLVNLALAAAVGATLSLLSSKAQGLAFALGVVIAATAQHLMLLVTFGADVVSAAVWFRRVVLAVVLKWGVMVVLMMAFMSQLKPAPLFAIAGVAVSLLVVQLFNLFDTNKVKRSV